MPVIIIVDAQPSEKLTQFICNELGFTTVLSGYFPDTGNIGDVHWPIKDELPPNVFYHSEGGARGVSSVIRSWAGDAGIEVERVFAFETTHWYVSSEQPTFDHDKPGVKWEDFPRNARSKADEGGR